MGHTESAWVKRHEWPRSEGSTGRPYFGTLETVRRPLVDHDPWQSRFGVARPATHHTWVRGVAPSKDRPGAPPGPLCGYRHGAVREATAPVPLWPVFKCGSFVPATRARAWTAAPPEPWADTFPPSRYWDQSSWHLGSSVVGLLPRGMRAGSDFNRGSRWLRSRCGGANRVGGLL